MASPLLDRQPAARSLLIKIEQGAVARDRVEGALAEPPTIAFVDSRDDEAAPAARQIVEEVKQSGVTSEELAKAKKISLSHHLASLTTMRGQASDLGSNWFLTRNLNFTRDYLEAAQSVNQRANREDRATFAL